jgi:hypothetical protein
VLNGTSYVRRLEKLFGGNATTVKARASDLVSLDDRDIEARRGPIEGGRVTAGSSTNDNHVELLDLVSHKLSLRLNSEIPRREILMF